MAAVSNNFSPFPTFQSTGTNPSLLLNSPLLGPTLHDNAPLEGLQCPADVGFEAASTRELNVSPGSLESNPGAAAQVNQAQGETAEKITGEGGEKKEKKSVGEDVHDGVSVGSKVLTAPEKLKNAGEGLAKLAEKGAAGELGPVSKLAEKLAPKLGQTATKWGEAGEKLLAKTPVVGKYAGKVSEYAEKATGMLAGDVNAFKDTAKDLAAKGDAFCKGVKEGGSLKSGVTALKNEIKGESGVAKAGGETAKAGGDVAKAGESAAASGAEHAAADGAEHVAAHAAEKAAVEGAEHVGLHAGEKIAGKLAGKLIPGVNVAVAAYSAYSDGKQAVNEWKSGNKTGAIIDGLHTLTDAAGAVPGLGTAVSIGGDVLAAGAHWLFGK